MSVGDCPRRLPHACEVGGVLLTALATAILASCDFPRPAPPPPLEIVEETGTPTATKEPEDTPTFTAAPPTEPATETPTATITPTATLGPPMFTATMNANCRTGPGLVYDVVRVVLAGASEPIVGRDAASTWWVVQGGARCWISNVTGTASGDLSGVPVVPAPPTPTPSPTPTPTLGLIPLPGITIIPLPRIPVVSAANVTVDRTTCMPCPCRATWSGTITATGPLTASYVWQTKHGTDPWTDTLSGGLRTFSGAGTLNTDNFWIETSARRGSTVTARLRVTSPNEVYSNEVSVRFCAP